MINKNLTKLTFDHINAKGKLYGIDLEGLLPFLNLISS